MFLGPRAPDLLRRVSHDTELQLLAHDGVAASYASPYDSTATPYAFSHDSSAVSDAFPHDGATTAYAPSPGPENPVRPLDSRSRWLPASLHRWRLTVLGGFVATLVVFLVNLIVTLWAVFGRSRNTNEESGRYVLYEGSCEDIRPINTFSHLIINVLSTALLSASNYSMQCLSAPTRKEVDKEHRKGGWLDIGVLSVRNLTKIGRLKSTMWLLLGLSSLPLHLFYNSAVFSSISANKYAVFIANEAFADPNSGPLLYLDGIDTKMEPFAEVARHQVIDGTLERLDPLACIDAYAQQFQTRYGNVVLIEEDPWGAENSSRPTVTHVREIRPVSLSYGAMGDCAPNAYWWVCTGSSQPSSTCNSPCNMRVGEVRKNPDQWDPLIHGYNVLYCLAEPAKEHCKLQFSLHIAILIMALNLVKSVLMLALVFAVRESPLLTMGDAVASFLRQPDTTTEGMCLLNKEEVVRSRQKGLSRAPRTARVAKEPYAKAASRTRWTWTILLTIFALLVCIGLLTWGIIAIRGPRTASFIFGLGFGAISPSALIEGWAIPDTGVAGIFGNVIVANSPQPIFSFIYFTYNGLMTSVALAAEWSSYSQERKGLRVSGSREGVQRSTYFLQLPYRYAIPLMVVSGLLHWLISQSLFLVSVEHYNYRSKPSMETSERIAEGRIHFASDDLTTCGYSPLAILITTIVGFMLVVIALVVRLRKMPATGMPVAGSCSLAIAAACHLQMKENLNGYPDLDEGLSVGHSTAIEPVQWGVVSDLSTTVGHCSFSAEPVTPPRDSLQYAGNDVDVL